MKEKIYKSMTIGCDPEFVLIEKNNKQVIHADNLPFFGSKNAEAEIGCDGCGRPVEIRPNPASIFEIEKFSNSIANIFKRIARYCDKNKLRILGGASYKKRMPIGGHIHFGSSDFLMKPLHMYGNGSSSERRKDKMKREKNAEHLAFLLDTFFIPIINYFIEPKNLMWRNETSSYGNLYDYRFQPHGLEYRTPYSFLLSPFLTRASFSLASLIAYHYKKITINPKLRNIRQDIRDYYYDLKNIHKLDKVYIKIKPMILKMMSHKSPNPKLNTDIISMFSLIERKRICPSYDVLKNYNLFPPPPSDFELIFQSKLISSCFNPIKMYIIDNVINEANKKVFIYEIPQNEVPEAVRMVYLSKGMPKYKPTNIYTKVEYKTVKIAEKYKNSIGLSKELLKRLYYTEISPYPLIEYLNKLECDKNV